MHIRQEITVLLRPNGIQIRDLRLDEIEGSRATVPLYGIDDDAGIIPLHELLHQAQAGDPSLNHLNTAGKIVTRQ